MISKLYKLMYAGLVSCGIAAALTACTDKWDDHYNSLGDSSGMHEGTLWKAIKSDPNLSNFASVVEGCGFDVSLNSSQAFTVFAPVNDKFSQAEAQALVAEYKQQVAANVVEEDNTVLKEFLQNHVALYSNSVSNSSEDSLTMMNGKYAVLKGSGISDVPFLTKNQLYSNGILYTIPEPLPYLSNVFEYVRKDADLDSLRSFLYNSKFYYREFQPELSVPGSIVNGKTQYLDSVFTQRNELFTELGRLGTEDSSYIMVAPTNQVWRQLIEEYEPYFQYRETIADRDSMAYTNSRLAIVRGTTFSSTFNTEESLRDSAMSENSIIGYVYRKSMWGQPFQYYQYNRPLDQPYGALNQTDIVKCSNGRIQKANKWNIDKLNAFHQYIIVEAEGRNAIKEMSKQADSKGDTINTWSSITRYTTSDNKSFYDRVWDNSFVEFSPNLATINHDVTFTIPNVLSNIGYDIYMVTVPALANDTNATEQQRLPTDIRFTINVPGKGATKINDDKGKHKDFVTSADNIDYLLVAEDFKFDYCTYGVTEENQQITLKAETHVTSTQLRNRTYTRTLRVDCIILVPHGTMEVVDALPQESLIPAYAWGKPGILMYPHGKYDDGRPYKWWYMLR